MIARCLQLQLIAVCAFLFGACAHTYHAPSNAKLEASTKRLSNAVVKATSTAERAKAHIEAAREAAKKEEETAKDLSRRVDELVSLLPPELKERGQALKKAVEQDRSDVGEIVTNVYAAQLDHVQLGKDLSEAKAADSQVKLDKQEYYGNADKLAATATKQSKDLAWYRWHWWGSWIALGVGVVGCIVFAVLKWGAKWSGKVAVAAAKTGI